MQTIDEQSITNQQETSQPQITKLVKRSIAIHTGYVGTNYKGSCVNRTLGDNTTIEHVLENALYKAGLILESNYGSFARSNWTRASRTDKGVHSLGTVMGLRMHVADICYTLPGWENKQPQQAKDTKPAAAAAAPAGESTPAQTGSQSNPDSTAKAEAQGGEARQEAIAVTTSADPPEFEFRLGDTEGAALAARINAHLPPDVTVFAVQKVNKKFNARHMCNDRTYDYYLPCSLLGMKGDGSSEDAAVLEALRSALRLYEGYHPFHNYTKRKAVEAERSSKHMKRKWDNEADRKQDQQGNAQTGATPEQQQAVTAAEPGPVASAGAAPETAEPVHTAMKVEVPVKTENEQIKEEPQQEGTQEKEEEQEQPAIGSSPAGPKQQKKAGKRKREQGSDDENEGGRNAQQGDDSDDDGGDGNDDDADDLLAGYMTGNATNTPTDALQGQEQQQQQRTGPTLLFKEEPDPKDIVSKTFYRMIKSFTAADPEPLVPGGPPCTKVTVQGQSFMIHHIRHMIGGAVAVARGLISTEVLRGSLSAPSRVTLPRAPPHTLILADCSFHYFPRQHGTGDNDLINVTGPQLALREGGTARKEEFRSKVVLPALQNLVELPDWDKWLKALHMVYPFDTEQEAKFVEAFHRWEEMMRAKKEAKAARFAAHQAEKSNGHEGGGGEEDGEDDGSDDGDDGDGNSQEGGRPQKKHKPTQRQRQQWRGRGGGRGRRGGGGRGRGGRGGR